MALMTATTPLHCESPPAWVNCVIERLISSCSIMPLQKKAAGMALSMLSHYPDRARLVTAMSLAAEEMVRFREVVIDSGEVCNSQQTRRTPTSTRFAAGFDRVRRNTCWIGS